ncbi:cysteine desulfurase [Babesia ovis]|uniref:cysteine desulfurase n=1 Tax=Babesia ovis TaxID=5869 RepID=A0A9W5TDL4_BABOV|nr:cysteine desulfurase [Babesia ovis]
MITWKGVPCVVVLTLFDQVRSISLPSGYINSLGPFNTVYRPSGLASNVEPTWRTEFPAFNSKDSTNLIYFDNAATTQKPLKVIEAISRYYSRPCANVHRSQHPLATAASDQYESARENVARFINAPSVGNIVFTSGATDAINLVANSWCFDEVGPGDVILVPLSEHNSNIIPWQLHTGRFGTPIHYIKLNPDGSINLDDYMRHLQTRRVKLVSIAHASNVLGKIQDLGPIVRMAHEYGAKVLVDACQTIAHVPIDVTALDCDFLVASGHKMYGPTGIGFLYAKTCVQEYISPYKGGGGMVKTVTSTGFELDETPHRFEPGTPPLAQAIGLSAAIDFLRDIGFNKIASHEQGILQQLDAELRKIATVHSPPVNPGTIDRVPIVSFSVEGVNPLDLASLLALRNVAVRAGTGGDSILRVDPKLVPAKQLGKTLLRIGAMGLERSKVETILVTCATHMGHAMDGANVSTYLSLMAKLRIGDIQCLQQVIPYCYKIQDLPRAISCCHLISMVPNSRYIHSCRAFVVHVAQRVPVDGHSIGYQDLGRLCESLRCLDLYCQELGSFLIKLIETEFIGVSNGENGTYCGDVPNKRNSPQPGIDLVYLSSILSYIGAMGMGTPSLWRMYSRHIEHSLFETNPRVLLKTLESFCARRLRDRFLLEASGTVLSGSVDKLHPTEVARLSQVYASSGYYHGPLCHALMQAAERAVPLLDAHGAIKILQPFLQAYTGFQGKVPPIRDIPHHHLRALYLVFSRCATGIGFLCLPELLVLTHAMRLVPSSVPPSLIGSLQRLLSRAMEMPKGSTTGPCILDNNVGRSKRLTARELADIALAKSRRSRLNITRQEALMLSQLAGTEPLHIHQSVDQIE